MLTIISDLDTHGIFLSFFHSSLSYSLKVGKRCNQEPRAGVRES